MRAEPLLLVRINASGGLILRMGSINRCLKHPLARDTPVCLLAVLGEQQSRKNFLLQHLLQGLQGLVRSGTVGQQLAGVSLRAGQTRCSPSPHRSVVRVTGQEVESHCLGSGGAPAASAGASGCGASPSS